MLIIEKVFLVEENKEAAKIFRSQDIRKEIDRKKITSFLLNSIEKLDCVVS